MSNFQIPLIQINILLTILSSTNLIGGYKVSFASSRPVRSNDLKLNHGSHSGMWRTNGYVLSLSGGVTKSEITYREEFG